MKKILLIVGGVVLGVVLLVVIVFVVVLMNSKKLECTSFQGSITIMHNDDTINGYAASDILYDFDGQKAIAESVGVEAYLEEFNDWFRSNTDGICVKR